MFWNRRRLDERDEIEVDSKVEVVAHKAATKAQVQAVRDANATLNKVLAKNGFTIKIYLAAGGNPRREESA